MLKWVLLPLIALASIPATNAATKPDRDANRDGIPDHWERRHGISTTVPSATFDPDGDRLTNRREFRLGTNPRKADTDRDGLRDGAEFRRYRTDPGARDTDRDGLGDGAEVRRYHTNPRKRDTDGDGVTDGAEVRAGTNPLKRTPPAAGAPAGAPADPGSQTITPAVPGVPGAQPGRVQTGSPPFPGESNTGVPSGTTLTAYTGPSTITTANTVIDGKSTGCLRVRAPAVVIRNSRISCSGEPYAVLASDGDFSGTPLLIEDSEIDCGNGPGTALGEALITARRVDIRGCENGGDINQKFTVEDSYIHDLYNDADTHTDGFQFAFGHLVDGNVVPGSLDVTIRHNTIFASNDNGQIGNAAIISNRGADVNILIEKNLMAGGTYTLYCEQGARGTNYQVLNNVFSRRFSTKVGLYGPWTDCMDETHSGNVFDDGRPVLVP